MAEQEPNVELAEGAAKSSGKLKIAILVVAGMLVAGGATVGALFALGMLSPAGQAAVPAAAEQTAAAPRQPAIYVDLDPAFTVNFAGEGEARYLQVSLEAMTRDPDVETALKRHMPRIRNDLTVALASRSPSELATREGKEQLQADLLAKVQEILQGEIGSPGVEAIYFTTFVMQ